MVRIRPFKDRARVLDDGVLKTSAGAQERAT
jgi:hypothetical protein